MRVVSLTVSQVKQRVSFVSTPSKMLWTQVLGVPPVVDELLLLVVSPS